MCNRQRFYKKRPLRFYCNLVSSIFSTFSVDIQVNFCLIRIQLLTESNETHGIPETQ